MDTQVISTSPSPEIIIEQIDGSLQVKGWENAEVNIKADSDELSLQEEDDSITIRCSGNCAIRLPYHSSLRIDTVHGDARLKLIEDQLAIERIHGNLTLRDVAETIIATVDGDFSARRVQGDIQVERVHGNAMVRDVQGDCRLDEVDGNLEIRDIEGSVNGKSSGNLVLRLGSLSGASYSLEADGNVLCRVPEDASLSLNLRSGGESIRVYSSQGVRTLQQGQCDLTLGSGEIPMHIGAEGVIQIEAKGPGYLSGEEEADEEGFGRFSGGFNDQMAQQIQNQINAQMDVFNRQINDQMAQLSQVIGQAGFSPEQTERMMKQARESSERATTRAQEKMRRAQEKLERKLEAARRREEMRAQSQERRAQGRSRNAWGMEWPSPPTPPRAPAPPAPGATDEERLMILRMLEQKKITLEEAEELLSALEE